MPLPNADCLKNLLALLAALFIFSLPGSPEKAYAQENKRKEFHLFGTKEFRASYKSLPKWVEIVNFEKGSATFQHLKGKEAGRWSRLREQTLNAGRLDKIKRVNNFFNRWPYRTDMEAWGKSDYWAKPKEFIAKSGDCEDYAIIKYFALKDLGVPIEDMRIVLLNDTIRGLGHAVLAVDVDGTAYILDNVSSLVLTDDRLPHYKPEYSVNEYFRWVHLPAESVNPAKSVIN
ncbi:MAG: transglutaminase-like cysteine peptidase [Desulfovibrionaceae bacterium]|nr:transglutaminase-like cysteine peptidase [Desulfovibrionaceae bacterium]